MAWRIEQRKGIRSAGENLLVREGLANWMMFEQRWWRWRSWGLWYLKEECYRHSYNNMKQELTWLSYYPSKNSLLPWCGQLPFSVFLYALVFTSKIAFIIRCCIVRVYVCFSQLDVGFLRAGTSNSCLLSIYLMAWLGVRYSEILIKKWIWPYGPHSYSLIIFTNEM